MPAPRLPTELWRTILRHATYVPYLLETEWSYDPDGQIWAGWKFTESNAEMITEASRTTKLAIVLVCRLWKVLGVEFLYEAIRVPRDDSVKRVMQLVEIIKRSVSENDLGYAWWIKRLDCFTAVDRSPECLISLLHQCHNLRIFITLNPWKRRSGLIQKHIADTLQTRFSHSLRRVVFANQHVSDQSIEFVDTLPNIPLTSLSITLPQPIINRAFPSYYSSISTLDLRIGDPVISLPSQWYLPNLRRLSLLNIEEEDVPALASFIERHRDTLVHLHLGPASLPHLPSFIAHATNLRSLAIPVAEFHMFVDAVEQAGELTQLRGVTHLGIYGTPRGRYKLPGSGTLKLLMDSGMFPDLKIIRLLREPNLEEDWDRRELTAMFRDCGIRFEDPSCNLMYLEP